MILNVTFNEDEVKSLLHGEEIFRGECGDQYGCLPPWFIAIVKAVRPDLLKQRQGVSWSKILKEHGKDELPSFEYDAEGERT